MAKQRLIDASPFDEWLIKIPEDVYDACSFVQGMEAVLEAIRSAPTIEQIICPLKGKEGRE